METFSFRIILANANEIVDDTTNKLLLEMSDALFEAGGDDSSPGTSGGVVYVDFDREANTLREAIDSAIHNIHQAGYHVAQVEPQDRNIFEEVNATLTTETK